MKKLVQIIFACLIAILAVACKHPGKEPEITKNKTVSSSDDITKDMFVDDFGDKMEVIINNTTNTATIQLEGKTYQLKKNPDLPEYTASDTNYQYSDIKGEIIFLKKDIDMVLFHHKRSSGSHKEQSRTKIASY